MHLLNFKGRILHIFEIDSGFRGSGFRVRVVCMVRLTSKDLPKRTGMRRAVASPQSSAATFAFHNSSSSSSFASERGAR